VDGRENASLIEIVFLFPAFVAPALTDSSCLLLRLHLRVSQSRDMAVGAEELAQYSLF
jgi:hypothetical protein